MLYWLNQSRITNYESRGLTMIEKMRLKASETVLVVVDVQERLARVMERRQQVEAAIGVLIRAAKLHDIPIILTQQYTKGLGPTVQALQTNSRVSSRWKRSISPVVARNPSPDLSMHWAGARLSLPVWSPTYVSFRPPSTCSIWTIQSIFHGMLSVPVLTGIGTLP